DTTVTVPPGTAELSLELSVKAQPSENLDANLQFRSGNTLLFQGHASVKARAVGSTNTDTAATVPVTYVGPGAQTTKVVVSPASGTFPSTAPITFTARTFDAAGVEVTTTPVVWSAKDTTLGTMATTTGVL